jgi:threonine dehydrogenase-like Zn-dependent dehydrogenase
MAILSIVASTAAGASQISSFIKSVVVMMAGLAGMIAAAYFVFGGISYIVSSGHPQRLEKAKRTIFFAAIGLAITIAAFVLSNMVSQLATNAFGAA